MEGVLEERKDKKKERRGQEEYLSIQAKFVLFNTLPHKSEM